VAGFAHRDFVGDVEVVASLDARITQSCVPIRRRPAEFL
jgi:hypothetical protein